MKKAYIVTSGEYSDYSIEGVFSTQEKAEAYIASKTWGYSQPLIEIFTVDHMVAKPGYSFYSLTMREDGSLVEIKSKPIPDDEPSQGLCGIWAEKQYGLCVRRLAKSEAAVIKVANEIRTQRIATLGWPKFVSSTKFVSGQNFYVGGHNPYFEIDEPDTAKNRGN